MRALALLVLAVLLAGCSDAVPSRKVHGGINDPTHEPRLDPRQVPPSQHLWASYGGGTLTLEASQREAQARTAIPEGAQTLVVNLTLVEGVLIRPRAEVAGCAWSDDQTWVAIGQTLQFGCNDPIVGNATLVVSHEGASAELRWTAEGVVKHCVTGYPC